MAMTREQAEQEWLRGKQCKAKGYNVSLDEVLSWYTPEQKEAYIDSLCATSDMWTGRTAAEQRAIDLRLAESAEGPMRCPFATDSEHGEIAAENWVDARRKLDQMIEGSDGGFGWVEHPETKERYEVSSD